MKITNVFNICSALIVGAMVMFTANTTPETTSAHPEGGWLGATQEKVLEELGVPARIDHGIHGSAALYYREKGKRIGEPTFRLHGGVVIWVSPECSMKFIKTSPPSTGAYLGQNVKELVTRLGQPEGFSTGQFSTQIKYKNGLNVSLTNGMVVGILNRK